MRNCQCQANTEQSLMIQFRCNVCRAWCACCYLVWLVRVACLMVLKNAGCLSTRSSMSNQNFACVRGCCATKRCMSCSVHMLGHCLARSVHGTSIGFATWFPSPSARHIESITGEYTSATFAVMKIFNGPCTAFRLWLSCRRFRR